MEMHQSVPNLHQVRDVIVQFEYEGVTQICRRCCRTGHHAAKCTVPQCVRCAVLGHGQCALKCECCGGDHGPSECQGADEFIGHPAVASSSSQEQASPAGAPGTSPADAPAAEDKEEPMSWTDAVRGKKRPAHRPPGPSKERLAAASSGGPGSPKDDLPVPKRPAATESDEESTSSTVTGSTVGYSSTNEDSLSEGDSRS
ncbi:hypothetical protein MRX96_022290 [Rhipicephalus microplus]